MVLAPHPLGPARHWRGIVLGAATATILACAPDDRGGAGEGGAQGTSTHMEGAEDRAAQTLGRQVAEVDSAAREADELFRPLPLLNPGDEASLRAYPNSAQLARARRFGIPRNRPAETLEDYEREGRLVRLTDSDYWVIRDLDYSEPLVVPAVRDLLTEIGERFHSRLEELGAPAFRFEISSLLRTAADQEALRAVNPNAALGESTHEYATTVDVLYSAFAAPAEPLVHLEAAEAEWLSAFLERYAEVAAERIAARRAMELKALLGQVLQELQHEGRVMVTLERQQPVFHMTLAAAP